MTRDVLTRMTICIVVAAAGSARAQDQPERRQVVVIDLSEDSQVKDLSDGIYKALSQDDSLKSPDKRQFDPYLTGPLDDEDRRHVDNAVALLASAQTYLAQFDNKNADTQARLGEKELAQVAPSAEVQTLYADLSLVVGLANLDQHKADANLAFAFTHRLDPSRELDPVRFPPDIIEAYQRAAAAKAATFPLEIKAVGRVWIDFVERGPAPGTFDGLDAGDHVVSVTGAERLTDGRPIVITAATTVTIDDDPASDEIQVKRARLELSRAQTKHDDVGRSSAMHKLAKLLGVGDAVMISKRDNGKLQWETWRDRAPGFSAPKLYTTGQKPEDLLDGLASPRKAESPKPPKDSGPVKNPPIVIEKPWYEQRWVQASAAATVVTAIIGGIIWARRDKPLGVDPNVQVVQGGM